MAVIWYYPNSTVAGGIGALTLEEIDLGEVFGGLFASDPDPDVSASESVSGVRAIIVRSNRLRVRLHVDRIQDVDLINQLRALESHLQRGGVIAIANNANKAWAGALTAPPKRADTVIRTYGNPWGALSGGTQQVAAGDVVVVSSRSPEALRHYGVVDSAAYGAVDRVTFDAGLTFTPSLGPYMARHADFYPALIMADPGERVCETVSDGRGLSIDVDLVEHLPTLAKLDRLSANYFTRSDAGGSF